MRPIVALLTLLALVAAAPAARCRMCLYGPDNMAFDRNGNLYVTDSDQRTHNRLLHVTRSGIVLGQWDRFVVAPGGRNGPEGVAAEGNGDVLVTDGGIPQVLRVAPSGQIAGRIGPPAVRFRSLGHVAVAPSGRIYVCDGEARTISVFDERLHRLAQWTRPRGSGTGAWGMPESIAVTPTGNLVVEDWANRRIEILSPDGRTLAIFGGPARFRSTAGIATDARGSIYVADIGAHRIVQFDRRGRFERYIGAGLFDANGPSAVAVDRDGTLYSPDGRTIIRYTADGRVLARWF